MPKDSPVVLTGCHNYDVRGLKRFGNGMKKDRWASHRFFLYFFDSSVESKYRTFILERAMVFTRVTWILVIVCTIAFSFLDKRFFGESAGLIMTFRAIIIVVAIIAQFFSLKEKYSYLMDWNGFFLVFILGMFCNILISLDTIDYFSIYFTALFLIFPAVFCTAGLGFRYSFFAFIFVMIGFDGMFGLIFPMRQDLFVTYNVFLGCLVLVYVYLTFLVERIFRRNFITSEELKLSLSEVHQLTGLLPICANCKKIRDDTGYWSQVEEYIGKHSEAEFSHSICPDCIRELYPDIANTVLNKTEEIQ